MPRDPVRSVRIDDPRWNALLTASIAMGISVSEVIRFAVDDLLDKRQNAA